MAVLQYNQLTSLAAAKLFGVADTSDVVVPPYAKAVLLQAETQNVRFRHDGTSPTASVGVILIAGDAPIRLDGQEIIRALRVIETTTSAKLNIAFLAE